jgi:NAD(P)-dependent dehydrogenase (short-subunit alcohol dehydrogenase family)
MRSSGGGVVVNIASTAGLGYAAYSSPEYAAAKAGLIRFTATLAELAGVRVTCVVPDLVGTERAARERSETPPERWAPWVPLEDFTAEVLTLIEDDTAAGRVTVLLPGRNPAVLA